MEIITSRQNPLCTHLRKLAASGSYRRGCGEFLCDSPKLLEEALLWKGDLHTVVATAQAALPPIPAGVRVVQVPPDVMASVSPAQTPQGVLSVCGLRPPVLPEKLTGKRYMVLDGVQDPGNVGTILRTADAFRADGLFLVNACADLYNPKTVRATMGAVFRCPVWSCGVEELRKLGFIIEMDDFGSGYSSLRRRPAGRHGGCPHLGVWPLRHRHRQRGQGPFPGDAGGLRPDGAHPHERAL